jgi:hypothetical protein
MITVVLHDFDFAEADRWGLFTLDDMERTLDWLTSQSDISVMSVGQVARSAGDIGVRRFLANRAYVAPRLAPPFLRVKQSPVYLSTEVANGILHRVTGYSVVFYLASLLGSFVFAYAAVALVTKIGAAHTFAGAAALVFAVCLGHSIVVRAPGYTTAAAAAVSVGVAVGAWLFSRRRPGNSGG